MYKMQYQHLFIIVFKQKYMLMNLLAPWPSVKDVELKSFQMNILLLQYQMNVNIHRLNV